MTAEHRPLGERLQARTNGILDAQNVLRRNIWNSVPGSAHPAYGRLEAAVRAGVDVRDPFFAVREEGTIRQARPAFNAKLEEALVNSALFKMLTLSREQPRDRHVVELFPSQEVAVDQEPSAMDLVKAWPDKFLDDISRALNARIKIAGTLVVPDQLSRSGLSPRDFYSSIIVGNMNIFTLPTTIEGVYLRTSSRSNLEIPAVDFVMDPL